MKKALALLCNDMHITKDNIVDFSANWREMMNVAHEYEVEDIVIGGDVFTSMSSQSLPVLMQVKSCVEQAIKEGFHLTVANGNHDKADKESVDGYCSIFSGYENYNVVDKSTVMLFGEDDVALAVMSYFPENGSFVEKLEELKERIKVFFSRGLEDVVLYIHEGIHGALGDFDIPGELPQNIFERFHSVLCGHYHNRTKVGKNIFYIGASRQHNFGEDIYKGYTILFSDGSTEFVENEVNARYETLETSIDDIDNVFMKKLAKYQDLSLPYKYKVRVKIYCTNTQAENFDKRKLFDAGVSKVEMITDKTLHIQETCSKEEKFNKQDILIEYKNFCGEKGIDSKLGMEYLNQLT